MNVKRDIGSPAFKERGIDVVLQGCWRVCVGEGRATGLADHRTGVRGLLLVSAQVGKGCGYRYAKAVVDGGGLVDGGGGRGLRRGWVIHILTLLDLFSLG